MDGYKSFLQARDPSILAWNRPKINPSIKMDLCSEFSESTFASEESNIDNNECLQVYLRIKPTKDLKDLYEINDNILVCRIPAGSQALRNMQEGNKLIKQFSFTKIYGPEVSQTEIFNNCIKKKVLEFINGKNGTIFTYGTSGSGKTYTILGTSDNPGIIPRALEYIFRTLPEVKEVPTVKPSPSGDLISLDTTARKNELNVRHRILNDTLIDKSEHIETYKLMQQRLSTEPTAVLGNAGVSVGLWVSFAEIYNEYVYDLLVSDPGRGKQRPKLRLAQDSKGNPYVKDLRNVSVSSGLEAYEILQYGMQNLSYASTSINSHSSRSHCIFSIKLVQWVSETEVQISHFNFCDLAGSERVKNTRNVGDRLKESNNINTSLHVLGRCIESIRKSQKSHDTRMIPFRDSKLTRLFQRALSGQESLTMVVNINTTREMFDESQHVLNFSAIAREIITEKEIKPEKQIVKKRFSQYIHQSTALPLPKIDESEVDILRDQLHTVLLERENQQYIWAEKETQIRREMMETFRERNEKMRQKWEARAEAEKQSIIDSYLFKIDHYERQLNQNAKRARISSVIELDDTVNESELDDIKHELEIKSLELDRIKERLKVLDNEKSTLQTELTQTKFDLSAQAMEMQKKDARIKTLMEELTTLRKSDLHKEKIINQADVEAEELEKQKKDLESQLEEKCIENFDLRKINNDLNDQLSAYISEKTERTEHIEQLEEKYKENYDLHKKISDLENQLSAIKEKPENTEQAEETDEDKYKENYNLLKKGPDLEKQVSAIKEKPENTEQAEKLQTLV